MSQPPGSQPLSTRSPHRLLYPSGSRPRQTKSMTNVSTPDFRLSWIVKQYASVLVVSHSHTGKQQVHEPHRQ